MFESRQSSRASFLTPGRVRVVARCAWHASSTLARTQATKISGFGAEETGMVAIVAEHSFFYINAYGQEYILYIRVNY